MMHILNNLSKEYNNLVEILEPTLGIMNGLTVKELREQLRTRYQHHMQSQKDNKKKTALTMQGGGKQKCFSGKCFYCGIQGHRESECCKKKCKESNGNADSNQQQSGNGRTQRNPSKYFPFNCHHCGEKGHKQKDCPKQKEGSNNKNANISEEAAMVLVSEETKQSPFPSMMWFGDTSATGHMTNSEEGLTNIVECSSSVTVGNGKAVRVMKIGTLQGTVVQKDGSTQAIMLE